MLRYLLNRIPDPVARPNILLIDDDRDIRTVTSLVLLTNGLGEVHEAGSGQEGLEAARQNRPDVILLDFKLPDMNGETVLHLLKADPWTRDIPVIFFTAHASERHLLRQLPIAGLMLKPFHPFELCEKVRSALSGANSERARWIAKAQSRQVGRQAMA